MTSDIFQSPTRVADGKSGNSDRLPVGAIKAFLGKEKNSKGFLIDLQSV
ncbi:hypothetical protein F7734_06260 [Scytonema sp. UIC 10036]|nr:hypothetical protein [Scytonema sp. UIC 10036]MUG92081.1 hypothetical protein [Scytonema sp. UIC 10036]